MFPHTGEHDTRTKTCSSSLTSLTLVALTCRPVIAIKVEPLNNEREGGQEVIVMNVEVAVNLIVHCTHRNIGQEVIMMNVEVAVNLIAVNTLCKLFW